MVDYQATVTGSAPPVIATDLDWFQYIRPSRYCESDRLGPLARAEFAGLEGADLVAGISSWVGANVSYVPGSSRPIDGVVATLLAREGVWAPICLAPRQSMVRIATGADGADIAFLTTVGAQPRSPTWR